MKEFKKVLVSLLIVGGLLVVIDFFVGGIGDHLVAKNIKYSKNDLDNYRLNQCQDDILIVGSSRASRSFIPQMLKDSINNYCQTDYSLFNVGVPGHYMECTCCAIESILNRYTPKLLIIESGDNEVMDSRAYQQTLDYMDYYRMNPIVKKYIDRDLKNKIMVQCNMYRYNHKIGYIKDFIFPSNNDSIFNNLGYQPLYTTMTKNELDTKYAMESTKVDTSYIKPLLEDFRNVLLMCNSKNVNVVVVTSPSYKPLYQSQYIKSICVENNVPYIDMMNVNELSNDPENWYDVVHLTDKGAHIFTNMVFEDIKQYLPENSCNI